MVHRRLQPAFKRIKAMPTIPRLVLGILLLLGGILGALPILGFWMIPLGLLVLSVDFRWARKGYLSIISWLRKHRDRKKKPQLTVHFHPPTNLETLNSKL